MLLLCLLVQPAMGSMNADLVNVSTAAVNTDGVATHQSLLDVSMFPGATAITSPAEHSSTCMVPFSFPPPLLAIILGSHACPAPIPILALAPNCCHVLPLQL
jgi:hypothetical protein